MKRNFKIDAFACIVPKASHCFSKRILHPDKSLVIEYCLVID